VRIARVAISLFLLFAVHASAQTFEQLTFIRLTDAPMSARSQALGSTTDPSATDLALVATNPAALASLQKRLLSIGVAQTSYDTIAMRFSDNFVSSFRDEATAAGIAHAAIAMPLGDFVIAGYYANEPRLRGNGPLTTAVPFRTYEPVLCDGGACPTFILSAGQPFERRDTRYGLTASWQRGAIAVGAGAERRALDEQAEVLRSVIGPVPMPGPTNERAFRRTSGSDVVLNAGIVWTVTPRVKLSSSYRGGGEVSRTTSVCGIEQINSLFCATNEAQLAKSTQKLPDTLRAGVSIRATDRLLLAAEAVRRGYGDLAHDDYTVFGLAADYPYRDVTELHAGAEYRVPTRVLIALRAGWWRDPARWSESSVFLRGPLNDPVEHLTFGLGLDFGPAQLDVAVDNADQGGMRRASIALTHAF
jgi:long-subunit fatty acid transport protein